MRYIDLIWVILRPTYTLKKADLEKQENFMDDFETIKKN